MQRVLLYVLVLGLQGPLLAQAESTAARMQKVVGTFVRETGNEILGVGSWMSGRGYRDGLSKAVQQASDHDMRLLLPRGTPPDQAAAAWRAANGRLQELIRAEFGDDAAKVLQNTNLYPPTQLMAGVDDPAMAMLRFRQYNQVPNLGYTGAVTAETPTHLAEGLYGEGAQRYIQTYERSSGKLFYKYGDDVYKGLTDLTHLSEDAVRYTVRGTAGTAYQWSTHCGDALRAGDSTSVIKYLSRVESDLAKCRDLARLPTSSPLRSQIQSMVKRLKANPGALDESYAALRSLLRSAQTEAAVLARIQHPNFVEREAARQILKGLESQNELGQAVREMMDKLPSVPMSTIINGICLTLGTYFASRSLGEGDMVSVYTSIAPMFTGLSPALMMLIAQFVIEGARDAGYDLVAGRQEAFDLLDGIFVGGDVAARRYTIDELVANIHTEEGLHSFVFARSREAADRGFGPANHQHDVQTAEAIFNRCYPLIHYLWQAKRAELIVELQTLREAVASHGLLLIAEPSPVKLVDGRAEVTVTAVGTDPDDGERLARCKAILRTLLGVHANVYAIVTGQWQPAGAGQDSYRRRFVVTQDAGPRVVTIEQTVDIGAANLPWGSTLSYQIKRQASVVIEIAGEPRAPKAEPTTGNDRWRPPMPTITAKWLGPGWEVDGPYDEEGVRQWHLTGPVDGQPSRMTVVAAYVDRPTPDYWQVDPVKMTCGWGRPTKPPAGDAAWDTGEDSQSPYVRAGGIIVRWGLLLVEIRAGTVKATDSYLTVQHRARYLLPRLDEQLRAAGR